MLKLNKMEKELKSLLSDLIASKKEYNFNKKEDRRVMAVHTGCINRIYKIIENNKDTPQSGEVL